MKFQRKKTEKTKKDKTGMIDLNKLNELYNLAEQKNLSCVIGEMTALSLLIMK